MKKSPQHIHFGVHVKREAIRRKAIKWLKIHIAIDGVERGGGKLLHMLTPLKFLRKKFQHTLFFTHLEQIFGLCAEFYEP